MNYVSAADMRNFLRHRCEAAGGQKVWAAANAVSATYVGDVLSGRRDVSNNLAKKMGYQRTVVFSACNPSNNGAG